MVANVAIFGLCRGHLNKVLSKFYHLACKLSSTQRTMTMRWLRFVPG